MMGNELEKRGQLFFLVGVQKEIFPGVGSGPHGPACVRTEFRRSD